MNQHVGVIELLKVLANNGSLAWIAIFVTVGFVAVAICRHCCDDSKDLRRHELEMKRIEYEEESGTTEVQAES